MFRNWGDGGPDLSLFSIQSFVQHVGFDGRDFYQSDVGFFSIGINALCIGGFIDHESIPQSNTLDVSKIERDGCVTAMVRGQR